MSIKLTNTLSKKKEELKPINGKTIKMYSCGVTVYDVCHIGHARSLYVFNTIKKYLEFRGYDVEFVRNITDIDDKIINKAKELGQSSQEVADRNIDLYYKDLEVFGVDRADIEPRATENIEGMINHIQGLIDKNFAYEVGGDVYFKVREFKDYGKLSGQSIDKMEEGVRIELADVKQDPLDFALWKKSLDEEPGWDSPWGRGRPGWHIECSCMSMKHLNTETLDIHAGGLDLKFPHHENEIAQSEALTGKPFAKYWIHHGLVTINKTKMAKSLGNFITVQDAVKKYGQNELKFFFLTSHYASSIDFNEEKMIDVKKHVATFNEFFLKVENWRLYDGKSSQELSEKDLNKINVAHDSFTSAMDDDFNTPNALASMFALVDLGSKLISADKEDGFKKVYEHLKQIFKIFKLNVPQESIVTEGVLKLLKKRELARKEKDFKASDLLRDEIKSKFNLSAVDTAGGVTLF